MALQQILPQTSRAFRSTAGSRYVCFACQRRLADRPRQLHSTSRRSAPAPGTQSDGVDISALSRNEKSAAAASKAEPKSDQDIDREELEAEAQAVEDVRELDPNYNPAMMIDGLEWVGDDAWHAKKLDPGDRFEGWGTGAVGRRGSSSREVVDEMVKDVVTKAFGDAKAASTTSVIEPKARVKVAQAMAEVMGVRPSDFWLQQVRTVAGLKKELPRMLQSTRSTSLSQRLQASGLEALANVQVSEKRQRKRDEDVVRGRWKLIEQALRERELPVEVKQASRQRNLV